MAVNLIDSLQIKFSSLPAWANKPADLWFGDVWATRPSGAKTNYPLLGFTHIGTDQKTTFSQAAMELWGWRFATYEQSPQAAQAVYRGVLYGGGTPEQKLGFWYPPTLEMPDGYRFLHLKPIGPFRIEPLGDQFSPSGAPIIRLTWDMEMMVQQV